MKNIIAIQGYKNSGKDEVAKYIKYLLSTPNCMHSYWLGKLFHFQPLFSKWKIVKYADGLKKILSVMLNVSTSKFEERDFKENYYVDFINYKLLNIKEKDVSDTITDKQFSEELQKGNLDLALKYNLSVRQVLQFFGTDIIRRFFGDKFWIHHTLNFKSDNIIISDQRFIIENQSIRNPKYNSFIIHVIRPICNMGEHSSEKELYSLLYNKSYDCLIHNYKTLEHLFNECKNIIHYYF